MAGLVEYDFIKAVANKKKIAYREEDDLSITKCSHIEAVLADLPLNISIPEQELMDIQWREYKGEKISKEEALLLRICDQGVGSTIEPFTEIQSLNGFYFLNSSNCKDLQETNGVIAQNAELDDCIFFKPNAINESWKNWNDFLPFKHPTNALLIVDPYLFANSNKIDSLLTFINLLAPKKKDKFHLSVIITQKKWDINNKRWIYLTPFKNIRSAESALKRIKIGFEIVIVDNGPDKHFKDYKLHDREFYTNYSIITFGLPFSGKTKFSQKFVAAMDNSGGTAAKYYQLQNELRFWGNLIKNVDEENKIKSSKDFNNRLFEMFD